MTVLVDSSVWIEYFRGSGSPTVSPVRDSATTGAEFHTCGPVSMEVFAGARSDTDLKTIVSILDRGTDIRVELQHYEEAATIYRACRTRGLTIRSMIDCLIAAVAMSEDVQLLHNDRDFNAIADVVPLRIHPASVG